MSTESCDIVQSLVSDLGQCFGDPPAPGSAQVAQVAVPAGPPRPTWPTWSTWSSCPCSSARPPNPPAVAVAAPQLICHLNPRFTLESGTSPAVTVLKTQIYFPCSLPKREYPSTLTDSAIIQLFFQIAKKKKKIIAWYAKFSEFSNGNKSKSHSPSN